MIFMIGMLVGILLSAIIVAISLLNKLQTGVTHLTARMETLNNVSQLMLIRLSKLEQMSQATMGAAETFVDALRQSSRDMHMPMGNMENPDDFQDLRDTFEDGIRNFEEEPDDDEENWKK